MPKKSNGSKTVSPVNGTSAPGNAKVCEHCGEANSFRRVKCDKCGALLPEGKFERSRRMREQALRRERQLALTSNLFKDKPLIPDEMDDFMDFDHDARKAAAEAPTSPDTEIDDPEPSPKVAIDVEEDE